MWWSSAPNGATRAKARSSTGCPSAPISWCASRAGTMPATRSSSTGHLQAVAAAVGHRAAGQARRHRQWRRRRSLGADRGDRNLRRQGVAVSPRQSADRRQCHAHPAAPSRARRHSRDMRRGAGKIGTTGRGIGPAYEDKVGRRAHPRRRPRGSDDASTPKIERLLAHHNALRRGLGMPELDRRASSMPQLAEIAPQILAIRRRGLVDLLDERAPRRQAHPVRGRAGHPARHRSRHLSLS